MTLEELHLEESLRRREFPVAGKEVFLANAAVCPLPSRVAAAMSSYILKATRGDQELRSPLTLSAETRELAAELLGCKAENIALVGPTSVALSLVANGLSFARGDNVIFYRNDYPSNAVVWMNLEKKGVELRSVDPEEPGRITLANLQPLVDTKTRLVALASAHFIGGYRLDLDSIGAWLKRQGVLFCVDGIQTVGALPTKVGHVDFLAADAHKWLLGPCAAGIFYVNPAVQEQLEPTLLGWSNVICPGFITPKTLHFKEDASRYEAGSPNLIGLVGLHASLKLWREVTPKAIAETIRSHTQYIRTAVLEKGYTLACSDDVHLTGITAFRKEGVDMALLHKKLTGSGVTTSLRVTCDHHSWIRFSPHYYNTRKEIDTALDLL